MKTEYHKTLWSLRFEKMRRLEEEAAWGYQEILNRLLVATPRKEEAIRLLTQLVREERMHERLADELIAIVRLSHPECDAIA